MRVKSALSWALWLSIIGLGLAGYLIFLHLGLLRGELLGGPACSTGAFNCHAVTAGPMGSWLGVPLAFWGVLAYLAVFGLALAGQQFPDWAPQAVRLLFLFALAFVAVDLWLLASMVFVIRMYCLFCLLTYAVNAGLLLVAWRALEPPRLSAITQAGSVLATLFAPSGHPAIRGWWGLMFVGLVGTVGLYAGTMFVSQGPWGAVEKQARDYITKQRRVTVTVAGDPSEGPANAPIQVVEFSDFFCPACQRASKMNPIILANHRRDVHLVFKHYPLDMACNEKVTRAVHPGACHVAAAAECAHAQGKFWPFHDLLFEHGKEYAPDRLETDAAAMGLDVPRFHACLESGEGLAAVKRDIADGITAGVGSTPTYFINGVPFTGGITPAMFETVAGILRDASR